MNRKLKQVAKEWEQEFKADLFEGIKDIKKFLPILLDEFFPIWIEEARNDKDLLSTYLKFKEKIILAM